MSHLIHVIDYKKFLTAQGISCPIKQSEILNEAYTRALVSYSFRTAKGWTPDMEDLAWKQLDKWNKISPINAALIHQQAIQRINNLHGALATTGTLPCKKGYSVYTEDGTDLADNEPMKTLVQYLAKELGANRE
jgi:hypothetical protein